MERNAYHEQLEDTIVHLRAENERLRKERDELFEANGELAFIAAENKRLTAYARELQERISTLVNESARLKDLVRTLLENEPDDLIADGGITVLDGWRDSARYLLGKK
jgi:uncharacterized protein (DUF3084 family)